MKTIQRDIDFMRDEFCMPIEFDSRRNGYVYTEPVQAFPPVQIGVEELMALFVARKVMSPIAGTAVEHALREGFKRLAELAGASVHISWQELDQAFSVHEPGLMETDLALVELLSTALVGHRKLFLRYKSAKNRRLKARVIQPVHLAQVQGGWYLFAHDESVQELRIFALPRMQEVELLPDTFDPHLAFNLDDYLSGSMNLVTDPELPETDVHIRFTGYAAVLVAERNWHHSQQIHEQPDGSCLMHLRLSQLDAVVPWVISWSGLAEVLEPASLRDKVVTSAKAIANLHSVKNR